MHLNIRNFPDELHLSLIQKAAATGYDFRELVIEAVQNSLRVEDQVTCPLCGMDGPLIMSGSNARCSHCGSGFVAPEGV